MPSDINRLTVPDLVKGLHVVVKPCNLRRSLLFKEVAILAVPRSPWLPSKHFVDGRSSFVDGPCRPWPSRRRCCSGAPKGGHYIGTYGGPPMSTLRHPAKAKAPRSLIAVSIWLVQRYARARRLTRATSSKAISKARRISAPGAEGYARGVWVSSPVPGSREGQGGQSRCFSQPAGLPQMCKKRTIVVHVTRW
jgi:hypothetical protein